MKAIIYSSLVFASLRTSLAQADPLEAPASMRAACPVVLLPSQTNSIELRMAEQSILIKAAPSHDKFLLKAPRLWDIDRLPLPKDAVTEISEKLSPSERAMIFFNLLDHPDMVLGRMATPLMELNARYLLRAEPGSDKTPQLEGYSIENLLRRDYDSANSNYYLLKKPRSGSLLEDWHSQAVDHIFRILEAIASAPEGATSVTVAIPVFKNGTSSVKTVANPYDDQGHKLPDIILQIALEHHGLPHATQAETQTFQSTRAIRIANFVTNEAAVAYKDLKKFKPFFDWVSEKPERVAYAKLLLVTAIEPLSLSFRHGVKDDMTATMTTDIDGSVVQNRYSGVVDPKKTRPPKALSALYNLKVDIGTRLHAFPTGNVTIPKSDEPVYVSVMAPKIHEIKAIGDLQPDALVRNGEGYYDSIPVLKRLMLSVASEAKSMNTDSKAYAESATQVLERMENSLSSSSTKNTETILDHLVSVEEQISRIKADRAQFEMKMGQISERLKNFEIGLRNVKVDSQEKRDAITHYQEFEKLFEATYQQHLKTLSQTVTTLQKLHDSVCSRAMALLAE